MAPSASRSSKLVWKKFEAVHDTPQIGDKMIVIKEPYTSLILNGDKTMELRCRRVTGQYYLADSTTHTVKGRLTFGAHQKLTQEDYEATRHLHCVDDPKMRYKRTVGTHITTVERLVHAPAYKTTKGAIGFARFAPPAA